MTLTSTKGLILQYVRSLHKVPFSFQCIQHSWESSLQLGSQQTSLSVSWEAPGFPESPKPGRTPQDGHWCHWHLLPSSKSHICNGSSPREQAGVCLTENIAHDYGDGDWLMNTWLKYKMCWVDWCHWQLSHMKLKAVSVCYYIRGKARSGKNPGTWQISFNHIWQFSSLSDYHCWISCF